MRWQRKLTIAALLVAIAYNAAHAADVSVCKIGQDRAAFVKALAAQGPNDVVVFNCNVTLRVGQDPNQIVGLKSHTHIRFDAGGSLTTDDVGVSAIAIADVDDVTFENLNWIYDASPGTQMLAGPVDAGGTANSVQLKSYMAAMGAKFPAGKTPIWQGPTNASALLWVHGDVTGLQILGCAFTAKGANAAAFIPAVMTLGQDYDRKGGISLPKGTLVNNCTLDGTMMGFVGTPGFTVFENIQSHRHADLQGPNGESIGGVNRWFAPPHLFYFRAATGYPTGGAIMNVMDSGGAPTGQQVQRDNGSGTTLSLKLETNNWFVYNYTSTRATGCIDLLGQGNPGQGHFRNISCTFDSGMKTTNGAGVWGVRWPGPNPYTTLTLENVVVTDTSDSPTQFPFLGANSAANSGIQIINLHVQQKRPAGFPPPWFKNAKVQGEVHWDSCTGGQKTQAQYTFGSQVAVSCGN